MLGLDISDRSLKLIHLTDHAPQRLLSRCWLPLKEGVMSKGVVQRPDDLRQVVTQALAQCRIKPKHAESVVASIPETQSFLRVVEIPTMAEEEIDEAVQWEVAQHIPFSLENVYIDWQPVNLPDRQAGGQPDRDTGKPDRHTVGAGKMEVLVGVAQKQVIDPLYAVLHGLPLDVLAFELESQAIVRALISPELRYKQGLLIVDLGASATNVVVHDHGTVRFTASLQRGALDLLTNVDAAARQKMLETPPEQLQIPEQMAPQFRPAQEALVVEVHGVVEFYNSLDNKHTVREIILTGGGSNLPGLDQAFLQHFDNVTIQRGNPWVMVRGGKAGAPQQPMNIQESVHYATAVGLALRSVVI